MPAGLLPQYRERQLVPGQAQPDEPAEDQEDQAGRESPPLQVSLSVQRHSLRAAGGHRSAAEREEWEDEDEREADLNVYISSGTASDCQ